MADKEFSNVYQTIDFYSNIGTYCLHALFFRQIEIVVITDTDCSYNSSLKKSQLH